MALFIKRIEMIKPRNEYTVYSHVFSSAWEVKFLAYFGGWSCHIWKEAGVQVDKGGFSFTSPPPLISHAIVLAFGWIYGSSNFPRQ